LESFVEALDAGDPVYLSQWYAFRSHPELFEDFAPFLPTVLREDWLESIPRGWVFNRDTRNNIYWGGASTSTACHYDNYAMTTWHAVISGRKRWLLFSGRSLSGDREKDLEVIRASGLVNRDSGYLNHGYVTLPSILEYRESGDVLELGEFWTAEIGPGDILFIPSRWYHQTENLEDCLSISRFYSSAINHAAVCEFLKQNVGWPFYLLYAAGLGGRRRRSFLGSDWVQKIGGSKVISEIYRALARLLDKQGHFLG
jgi:hypothetical protein